MFRSAHRKFVRLGSLVLVLCLLAVPLCTARCSLSFCFQVNSRQQSAPGCHHQSAHSHGSCKVAAAPALSCVPTDSFLTALPTQQFRLIPASSTHNSPLLFAIGNSPSLSGASVPFALRIADRGSSPGDSVSFLSTSPLRV
jgi:hypothetical protein